MVTGPAPTFVVFEEDLHEWLRRAGAEDRVASVAAALELDDGTVVHACLVAPAAWRHAGRPAPLVVGRALPGVDAPERLLAAWGARLAIDSARVGHLAAVRVEDGRTAVSAWVRADAGWREARVLLVPEYAEAFARNRGILESTALAHRKVAVVGLGSGGATIASELVKAGVGRLVLADRDTLDVENVGRHVADLRDLGRRKTLAMRDRLLARNPRAELTLFDGDIVSELERFAELAADCEVLIGATDNNRSRRALNRLAIELGRPAIFGRAYTRACGGDVIRVRPGAGPCYECLFGDAGPAEEVSSSRSESAPAYADRPAVVEPGLALDIAPIALMCARLAIQELVRGTGSSLESLDEDLPGSIFMWGNRREGQFAGWAPMGYGTSGFTVQRWFCARAERRPGCPACDEEAFLRELATGTGLDASGER